MNRKKINSCCHALCPCISYFKFETLHSCCLFHSYGHFNKLVEQHAWLCEVSDLYFPHYVYLIFLFLVPCEIKIDHFVYDVYCFTKLTEELKEFVNKWLLGESPIWIGTLVLEVMGIIHFVLWQRIGMFTSTVLI